MEVLFESRSDLSNLQGSLHFVQWRPTIHPKPVVVPDTFVDRQGVSAYGSVLQDGGKLRMWYQATPEDWPGACDIAAVAHAESDDGIHWVKRPLALVEHGPQGNHLCDLALHSPSVFIDPDSPPSHRYRATGCGRSGFLARPNIALGYYTAHSADGLHWQLDSDAPRWLGHDVITSMYHAGRRGGIIALKQTPWVHRLRRRVIHTATFSHQQYTDHVSALYPDEYDDIAARQRGHVSSDYYGMAMMAAGQGTVGFLWNFRHDLPYFHLYPYGSHGHSDITLTYQERPGDRWLHMPGRSDFITRHDVPWASAGWIYSSSTPVEVGDEHRLYFSATNYEHMRFRDEQGRPSPRWEEWIRRHGISAMTFASWPKFRLFGYESPGEGSFDLEFTELSGPVELYLNVKAQTHGSVAVSTPEVAGHSVEDCVSLTGDHVHTPVAWKDGSTLSPDGQGRLVVRIHLNRAAVYAFDLVPIGG